MTIPHIRIKPLLLAIFIKHGNNSPFFGIGIVHMGKSRTGLEKYMLKVWKLNSK